MPSASIRKKVCGLIKTTFSQANTVADGEPPVESEKANGVSAHAEPYTSLASNNTFISQCILNRKCGVKNATEIYSGKTGLDLPLLMLETLSRSVRASYTGPEGGLTEVGGIRRQPIMRMANMDDELCLSFDGDLSEVLNDDCDQAPSSSGLAGSCTSLFGSAVDGLEAPPVSQERYDWTMFNEERCFGISTSLYERNPLTGVNAGSPIADAFGIVARENNVVMALADGVNWGEGARLAARCAVRGAIDHLNNNLFTGQCRTTTDVFHALLGAFHAAHALILQEGGLLTTLCVAVSVQLKKSNTWILCVCNVGDSLCFVYNPVTGVREVTVASHDICQMRDMRDAGGALGPVDGTNPQLHNLTCSMTFVEPDDMVFITSDGVSDNFDPVVGKFCVIKRPSVAENLAENLKPVAVSVGVEEEGRDAEFARIRTCNASLPCVDAEQRHELMLLRMSDIISNGILPPSARTRYSPTRHLPDNGVVVSAIELCHNLIQFAKQLSMAKRRTLEDPELYEVEKRLSKSEQRSHRRMVRCKLSEMPGKLDHASVVAYKVGYWPGDDSPSDVISAMHLTNCELTSSTSTLHADSDRKESGEIYNECEEIICNVGFEIENDFTAGAQMTLPCSGQENESVIMDLNLINEPHELVGCENGNTERSTSRSPYEETPMSLKATEPAPRKHPRGSTGRHTLSVDVAWLKKFVITRNTNNNGVDGDRAATPRNGCRNTDSERPQSLTFRQRLRSLVGSARNIIQTSSSGTPSGDYMCTSAYSKKVSSAASSPRKRPQAY